jgi:hypothetical protein
MITNISGLNWVKITLATLLLALALPPSARAQYSSLSRELTICKNTQFALCAASTCVATGTTITGNDGRTHPSASCTCPVLTGDNIADLAGGNIDQPGSCEPPDPRVNVYSTFEFTTTMPQKIGPIWFPNVPSVPQVCPASNVFAQCWNWKCTIIPPRQAARMGAFGVKLAQCTCPIEQTDYQFVTQAGQGNPAACDDIPVGGPLFFDPEEVLGGTGG